MQYFWFWIVTSVLFFSSPVQWISINQWINFKKMDPKGSDLTIHTELEKSAVADTVPGSRLSKVGIVLPLGAPGAFDDGMVESPVIWFDEQRGKYGMVYTAYHRINPAIRGYKGVDRPQVGLAWSDDMIRWEKDPRSPIFGPSNEPGSSDSHGTPGPYIWYENGLYYLFYFGTTDAGYEKGIKTLNLATSTDLINWKRHPKNPIIKPEGQGWRSEAIWHPHIVKRANRYYLFFNASGVHEGHREEFIGYAVSTNLIDWTVEDLHSPLVVGSRKPGTWDASGRAGDPSLYRVGDRWYMAWYSWDRVSSQDGLAWTTDSEFPLNWRMYEHNPVLKLGQAHEFDGLHAGKPFIVRTKERHFHFYTAVDTTEKREIALAVWPPLPYK
jgi:predicted GH43/DUF377 family glycosyl hydrolase